MADERSMKLNIDDMPERLRVRAVDIGDVFRNQRGALMVVIACQPNGDVSLVMFNDAGGVTGVQRYGVSYLREKRRVGRVTNLPTSLDVEWDTDD